MEKIEKSVAAKRSFLRRMRFWLVVVVFAFGMGILLLPPILLFPEDIRSHNRDTNLSPPAKAVYGDCLDNPVDLILPSDSLGLRPSDYDYTWIIWVDNGEPVQGRFGNLFVAGDQCKIYQSDHLRIDRTVPGFYALYPVEEGLDAVSCPSSAYTLISQSNEHIQDAIDRACLAKAKAIYLPSSTARYH